ncbi:hypothetical protein DFH29DRAFT_1070861 [Suillus ampliporus]|nr:hypothetical protein DFH29DRAFT_1070861 [Suillus ampliporus]
MSPILTMVLLTCTHCSYSSVGIILPPVSSDRPMLAFVDVCYDPEVLDAIRRRVFVLNLVEAFIFAAEAHSDTSAPDAHATFFELLHVHLATRSSIEPGAGQGKALVTVDSELKHVHSNLKLCDKAPLQINSLLGIIPAYIEEKGQTIPKQYGRKATFRKHLFEV